MSRTAGDETLSHPMSTVRGTADGSLFGGTPA